VLKDFRERLEVETQALESAGLLKRERIIGSPQGPVVELADGREMINLCANNYLGLANHPAVVQAAHDALSRYGYGVASVRFICGTQSVHRELEERLSAYLGMEDTILYSSCFDANGGLFETLLDERDAVISDALNHASIIDGIRLCKARRLRYANNDMNELEQALKDSQDARTRLIATDGVFSMDGSIARLKDICDLAERHAALVMVDDSHATGFMGARGRGTHELCGVLDRVDIITSTLGKALGGARGRTCSRTASRRPWRPERSKCSICSRRARSCASGCTRMRAISAGRCRPSASTCCPASIPSCPSCWAKRPLPCGSPSACRKKGCTWSRSPIQWCRTARPGFEPS
jgi:glycine C-acetyltransferase